jgi:GLPGLI family protein
MKLCNSKIYKSIFFLFAVTGIAGISFSQIKLTVKYKNGRLKGTALDYAANKIIWDSSQFTMFEFTVNNHQTYFYPFQFNNFYDNTERIYTSSLPLGSQFISHSTYCNYKRNLKLDMIQQRKNFLIFDTISTKENWILTYETKMVLGFDCKSALLYKNGFIDCVAWYTNEIDCVYTPFGENGLQGFVLEYYYPKYNRLQTAIEITDEAKEIQLPNKGTPIDISEFKKEKR